MKSSSSWQMRGRMLMGTMNDVQESSPFCVNEIASVEDLDCS